MPLRYATLAVAGWLALGAASVAGDEAKPEATGKPTPIGDVSHAVSPVGFIYTEAPGAPNVPPELRRRHRAPLSHKPAPKKIGPTAPTG